MPGNLREALVRTAESRAALNVAARLAGSAEAALRVIAVHDRGAWSGDSGVENPTGASAARADLEEQLHSAVGELPGELRALPVSEKGEPTAVLLERATERVDLLVIGSRGYGPVRTVLEGGVSAASLRRAPCPVVVTPRTALGRG